MAKTPELTVGQDACLEILNLVTGVFDPLKGFLNSSDYKSVVENMHLTDGAPWTIPITLDIPEEVARGVMRSDTVVLKNEGGSAIAELTVEDVYKVNFENAEKQNKVNVAELIIAKHRNGPTGKIEFVIDPNSLEFKEIDKIHNEFI